MVKIQKYQKFIVANLKLNGSINFTKEYLRNLNIYNSDFISKCLVICPPAPFCEYISKNSKDIYMGAQDCSLYDDLLVDLYSPNSVLLPRDTCWRSPGVNIYGTVPCFCINGGGAPRGSQ